MKLNNVFCTGLALVMLISINVSALNNGLARTPPMGFNTWNWFGCGGYHGAISEDLIKGIADAMVSSGMKDAGYQFVNLDDCWGEPGRNAQGGIAANRTRFPNGMRKLADYVHGKGLKLGIYTCNGNLTCAQTMPGMAGHENQDCDTFVAWGIDYVKVDNCGGPWDSKAIYTKISTALQSAVTRMKPTVPTAHELVYSLCNWGAQSPWIWGPPISHLWRTTGDIVSNWGSWTDILNRNIDLYQYSGLGAWNDPDMMQVGNGMPVNEDRAHFSLWCMLAAPLLAGNDLRGMSATTRSILINKEMIAVNQDTLGGTTQLGVIQGRRVVQSGSQEVWVKKLRSMTSPDYAVCFFNRGTGPANISVTWQQIGTAGSGIAASTMYRVRNLWTHTDLSDWSGSSGPLTASAVPGHDVVVLRLTSSTVGVVPRGALAHEPGSIVRSRDGTVWVDAGAQGPVSMNLVDMRGASVHARYDATVGRMGVSRADLMSGLYVVEVRSGKRTLARPVVLR